MNHRTRFQILDRLGVSFWKERHTFLEYKNPLMCPPCLVLLPFKPFETGEEKKIFEGMLSVLKLNKEKLTIAWFREPLKDDFPVTMSQILNEWLPYTVLMMGEKFAHRILKLDSSMETLRKEVHTVPSSDAWIQVTYHPRELYADPEDKSKAYQDLLCLKQQLSREML